MLSDIPLHQALETLRQKQILCLGDVMLDVEVECGGHRISPEAPVMVFEEGRHSFRPGGVANVAANVAALGANTCLAAYAGGDDEGVILGQRLQNIEVRCLLPVYTNRLIPTTRKTRFLSNGQQMLRIDREERKLLSAVEADALIDLIQGDGTSFNVILVSDYGKGVVTAYLMERLVAHSREQGTPILVDPKGLDWTKYGPVDLIKPNASELAAFTSMPCDNDAEVDAALIKALELCYANAILVTRAGAGATLRERGSSVSHQFEAFEVEVADVCGAGDTNLAMLGAMYASGCSLPQSIRLAQYASSLAVQRQGNAIISANDLLKSGHSGEAATNGRILAREHMVELAQKWREQGLKIGFTNGCFDILHPGHIHALEQVRQHCDRVVVGINSDASVQRLKGTNRPIVSEQDRAQVMAALAAVDAVTIFDEDTPAELIAAVRPDVLSKGGDYDPNTIVGSDFVRSYGGKVVIADLVDGRSTTSVVEKIRQQMADELGAR